MIWKSLIEAQEQTKPELLDKLMSTSVIIGRPSIYLQEMLSISARLEISTNVTIINKHGVSYAKSFKLDQAGSISRWINALNTSYC